MLTIDFMASVNGAYEGLKFKGQSLNHQVINITDLLTSYLGSWFEMGYPIGYQINSKFNHFCTLQQELWDLSKGNSFDANTHVHWALKLGLTFTLI